MERIMLGKLRFLGSISSRFRKWSLWAFCIRGFSQVLIQGWKFDVVAVSARNKPPRNGNLTLNAGSEEL